MRDKTSLAAGILIGLTFLASGTGKVLGLEEVPAQVVDFISNSIPDIFLTPATVYFLFNVLIPYILPWAELVLGCFLIIGFMPRLMAVLCLPLILAFGGTNVWSIIQGGYTTCASCFGVWEEIFGSLTPAQSLIYDIVLFALAMVIIVFHPGYFFTSRKWLVNLVKKKKPALATLRIKMLGCRSSLRNLVSRLLRRLSVVGQAITQRPRSLALAVICLLGLGMITCGLTALFTGTDTIRKESGGAAPIISDISVSGITEKSAMISWVTDEPTVSSLQVYDEKGTFIRTWTDKALVIAHSMIVDCLVPNTTYYFQILLSDILDYQTLPKEHYFTTLAIYIGPPVISNVRVCYTTESSVIITWATDKPTTGEVEYWLTGSSERRTASKEGLDTTHSINLAKLAPDATYHFRVKSTDAEGNQGISEPEGTFTLAIGAKVGKRAPNFTLRALDGKAVTLSDYRGKLVMLNFWKASCGVCRKKMPIIEEAFTRVPAKKITILNIHAEGRESMVLGYATGEGLTVPILLDLEGEVSDLYSVAGVPATFFVDGNGIIRLVDAEFSTIEELEDIFDNILGPAQE